MFDSIFRLLFSYRPVVFQQGEFRLSPLSGSYVAAALIAAAIVVTILTYRATRARNKPFHRLVLIGLRVTTLLLVLFCLFRPVLVVRAAVNQQNFVGVLIDDSRSMRIADQNGQPRGAYAQTEFGARDSGVLKTLADRFVVRTFKFSSAASRMASRDDLTFAGSQTRLGAALEGARQELAGLPLAGLVVVTDGADTTDVSMQDALLGLKAASIPVFTVGVGQEALPKDIQIGRISAPRSTLKGTSLMVDAVITQHGYAGEMVNVDVEDEGQIVGSQMVRLPNDGEPTAVRVRFTAGEPGTRRFRFRVAPRPGELVAENNARETIIDVRDRREKILYFEGEPRPEMKFLRRAVAEDENLQIVTLQRTADNKYLRLDVDHPEQLASGFPATRDELFSYRGVILGSIEAGAFTGDQLRMIGEFVEKRGGGLLVLGGSRSFAEGSYGGTPVADALPVLFDRPRRVEGETIRLKVRPTRDGAAHAITQLAPAENESMARWERLPNVITLNPIDAVKPGATVLLSGTDERGRSHVVLASQRYGRGKSIALPIIDTWQWQMHASIPVEDQAHENFWRQLLRWVVDGVPEHVEMRAQPENPEPGDTVTLTATVVDAGFIEANDARVVARVQGPNGAEEVPLQWTGEKSGEYRGTFVAAASGAYTVSADALRGAQSLGAAALEIAARPGDAEYFDATLHAQRLQRIAEDTGGRFYHASNVTALADDLRYTGRGVTTVEERDLWNLPIVLLLIVTLMCAEWGYRRAVGMA